jgi:hypothetical protein
VAKSRPDIDASRTFVTEKSEIVRFGEKSKDTRNAHLIEELDRCRKARSTKPAQHFLGAMRKNTWTGSRDKSYKPEQK